MAKATLLKNGILWFKQLFQKKKENKKMKFTFEVFDPRTNDLQTETASANSEQELRNVYKVLGREVKRVLEVINDREIGQSHGSEHGLAGIPDSEKYINQSAIAEAVAQATGIPVPERTNVRENTVQNQQQSPLQSNVKKYKEWNDNSIKYRMNLQTTEVEKFVLQELDKEEKAELFFKDPESGEYSNFPELTVIYKFKWLKVG
jgi:hypothetical protein